MEMYYVREYIPTCRCHIYIWTGYPIVPLLAPPLLYQKPGIDRNYCLIVFIIYMSYSDTWKVAKCCVHEKRFDIKKGGRGKKRLHSVSCPHVTVVDS